MNRRLRTGIRLLAAATVVGAVVAAGAIPSDSQENAGFTATQVSGSAFGVQADATIEGVIDGGGSADLGAVLDAVRNGDGESAAALLGLDPDAPVEQGASVSGSVGPTPQVVLPPEGGGPFTDSSPGVNLDIGGESLPLTGGIDVLTEGALGRSGFATSASRVNDFNPDSDAVFLFIADLIETECSADIASGTRGSTRFVNGEDLDKDIPDLPAPNTVLLDESGEAPIGDGSILIDVFLIANEQTVTPNSITVNGARGTFLTELRDAQDNVLARIEFNEIVSQSHCDIVLAPVVEPTFTG